MTRYSALVSHCMLPLLAACLLSCFEPSTRYYSVPPQVETAKPLPRENRSDRILLDEIESHAQVLHGFHPEHPKWMDGRWMHDQGAVALHYDPRKHRELILVGLVEGYQLKQVDTFQVSASVQGTRIGTGVVDKDGRFELRWPLPDNWNQAAGEVEVLLEASPSWQMEDWEERFTITLIEAAFEGAE